MKIDNVVLLNKEGKIVSIFKKGEKSDFNSSNTLSVLTDYYLWDEKKQKNSAEKYKDQIRRVFYQNQINKKVKQMLQDDVQRLELIKTFSYGSKVLEVGCSDGSASIKIAELPEVKKVIGIDIRKSAIKDGLKLTKDLFKRGEITEEIAKKVELKNYTVENFPLSYRKFDSVCAYEIFEHMAPQDMLPAFQHLYKFIKKDGNFFISVPNRFPSEKYKKLGRTRWRWFDHRNFFSRLSLEIFLKNFFKDVKFYPLYKNEKPGDSIYLICECKNKLHE